jgi:hypothetical protein
MKRNGSIVDLREEKEDEMKWDKVKLRIIK